MMDVYTPPYVCRESFLKPPHSLFSLHCGQDTASVTYTDLGYLMRCGRMGKSYIFPGSEMSVVLEGSCSLGLEKSPHMRFHVSFTDNKHTNGKSFGKGFPIAVLWTNYTKPGTRSSSFNRIRECILFFQTANRTSLLGRRKYECWEKFGCTCTCQSASFALLVVSRVYHSTVD